jgi:hypothetical protein
MFMSILFTAFIFYNSLLRKVFRPTSRHRENTFRQKFYDRLYDIRRGESDKAVHTTALNGASFDDFCPYQRVLLREHQRVDRISHTACAISKDKHNVLHLRHGSAECQDTVYRA